MRQFGGKDVSVFDLAYYMVRRENGWDGERMDDGGREWTMGERMYEREREWMSREGKNG